PREASPRLVRVPLSAGISRRESGATDAPPERSYGDEPPPKTPVTAAASRPAYPTPVCFSRCVASTPLISKSNIGALNSSFYFPPHPKQVGSTRSTQTRAASGGAETRGRT